MKFPPEDMQIYPEPLVACDYAAGSINFYGMRSKEEFDDSVHMICNPKTGRYASLPYLHRYRYPYRSLGFDPIDKQFKVLSMAHSYGRDRHKILTLGTGEMRWRKIKCSLIHDIESEGICINGVLYYLGNRSGYFGEGKSEESDLIIVCFDVRFEKFKFICPESLCQLINYKGRLGVIYYDNCADDAIELRVWVLEDLEKQEWSKYAYTLRGDKFSARYVSIVGVTAMGDIVLSMGYYTSKQPFYVFYFNMERNTLQHVEIEGFGEYHKAFGNGSSVHAFVDDCSSVYAFADHVEYLNVNDPKLLKSSIYAPYKEEEGREYIFSSEEEDDDDEEEKGEDR